MEASKVSFSQHTKEMLNARPLSRTHKAKLRKQRIVEYIRELPFGECQKSDLIAAAGWDIKVVQQYSNGWSFIERLRKNKVIRMSDGTDPKNSYIKKWEVVADTHVTKPADIPRVEPVEEVGEVTWPEPADGPTPPPADERKTVNLLDEAKNFAWTMNSDSLREFVAWVQR